MENLVAKVKRFSPYKIVAKCLRRIVTISTIILRLLNTNCLHYPVENLRTCGSSLTSLVCVGTGCVLEMFQYDLSREAGLLLTQLTRQVSVRTRLWPVGSSFFNCDGIESISFTLHFYTQYYVMSCHNDFCTEYRIKITCNWHF